MWAIIICNCYCEIRDKSSILNTVCKKNLILAFTLILSITSCTTYKSIDIQYYNLPKTSFPDCSDGLVIVGNYGIKSTTSKQLQYEWSLDSVAAAEAVLEMRSIMAASPLFSSCPIYTDAFYRSDTSNVVLPIRWDKIKEISEKNGGANIIVSLEYMSVKPSYGSQPTLQGEFLNHYGYLQIEIYCIWRVYDLATKKHTNSYLHRDTLLWEKTDWTEVKPGDQLPGVFSAAAYSGIDAARKFAQPLIPVWVDASRIIYCKGNERFEQAYRMALDGQWINAAGEWQKLIGGKDTKTAAKAAFNLALASEMLDKFDVALEWLKKARELNPYLDGVQEYERIINDRINRNK